jgi:D-amino peptidase
MGMAVGTSGTSQLRVLVVYDMEGLSGVDRQAMTTCDDSTAYAAGQDRLVADVNAVIEGLVSAGATSIQVIDRHGSWCDDDLPPSRLDARATFVDERSATLAARIAQRQWDAVALVGAHASPGWNGFLEHTGSFGMERILNGVSVSESELFGLQFGAGGIPVIFASGDDRLAVQLKERMPWVVTAIVKDATGRGTARLRAPQAARAELVSQVQAAVGQRDRARTVALLPPFTGAYKAVWPLSLERLSAIPGVDISAGLVRVEGASPREVNNAIDRIGGIVAALHTSRTHWEAVMRDGTVDLFRRRLFRAQWHDGPPVNGSSPR